MNIKSLTDDELAREYVETARRQGRATEDANPKRANKEFDIRSSIYQEIKRRGKDAFKLLTNFGEDQDPHVRVSVGWALLETFPDTAKPILTEVSSIGGLPGLDSKRILRAWEKGEIKFPQAAD